MVYSLSQCLCQSLISYSNQGWQTHKHAAFHIRVSIPFCSLQDPEGNHFTPTHSYIHTHRAHTQYFNNNSSKLLNKYDNELRYQNPSLLALQHPAPYLCSLFLGQCSSFHASTAIMAGSQFINGLLLGVEIFLLIDDNS